MKSKFVLRSSSFRCLGRKYAWRYTGARISSQVFDVASPGPYARTVFEYFGKQKHFPFFMLFSLSLTWDPMEGKFQYVTPPTNGSQKFSDFLNFLLNGPHKTTFGICDILTIVFPFR